MKNLPPKALNVESWRDEINCVKANNASRLPNSNLVNRDWADWLVPGPGPGATPLPNQDAEHRQGE